MKCIVNKHGSTKIIKRVTDEVAKALVKAGTHTYADKQSWKLAGRQR